MAMAGTMEHLKGQLGLKSSPLSPTSAKYTTQLLVLDHMGNHYRKISKAKSAIDNKPPKSMQTSQKVRDKQKREGTQKTGSRPNSAMRSARSPGYQNDDYVLDETYLDQPENEEERLVYDIMRTTLKPRSDSAKATHGSGSQTAEQPVMETYKSPYSYRKTTVNRPSSRSGRHSARPGSARSVTSVNTARRPSSARQADADLLKTKSHIFTEEKPFTPKTLKSNRHSKLSEYKFYTAPKKKMHASPSSSGKFDHVDGLKPKKRTKSPLNRTETPLSETTLMMESLQSRDFNKMKGASGSDIPRLDITIDQDHMKWLEEQAGKASIRAKSGNFSSSMNKIKEDDLLTTGTKGTMNFSLTGDSTLGKSGTMGRTYGTKNFGKYTNKEDELLYVEFVQDVTNDILNRGVFSNRVLKQVFESHIDRNKGVLDEERMRSLLDNLRRDLDIPNKTDDYEFDITLRRDQLLATRDLGFNSPKKTTFRDGNNSHNFDKTFESVDSYGFGSTAGGNLYDTINSEQNDELSATQVLAKYQMGITQQEASETADASSKPRVINVKSSNEVDKPQPKPRKGLSKREDSVEAEKRQNDGDDEYEYEDDYESDNEEF